nr:fimbrin [Quercus suber]
MQRTGGMAGSWLKLSRWSSKERSEVGRDTASHATHVASLELPRQDLMNGRSCTANVSSCRETAYAQYTLLFTLLRLPLFLSSSLIVNLPFDLAFPPSNNLIFQQSDIFSLTDSFRKLDVDDRGYVDEATAIKAVQNTERQPYDVVRQALKEVELDSSRRVELDDYVDLIARLRESSTAQQHVGAGPQRSRGLSSAQASTPSAPQHGSKNSMGGGATGGGGGRITVGGSTASSQHTINEDERTAFTSHINAVLAGDPDIGHLLPFPLDTFEMFDACKDGLVLAKLINDSVPDTIDERVLNRAGKKIKQLNAFHMTENNNIVIESAKGIGCSVVNIGSGDIIEVREHLILGLIWQVIRRGLLGKIDIKLHPELYRLLEDGETLEQFLRLPPEQILLRWFNYHLKNAKWPRKVQNFSKDVQDGENYTVLLNQLAPSICSRGPLQTSDLHQRAEQVLQNADALDPPCRKFLTPTSLVAGNPKLNLAFVANLFNNHPGLDPITEEEKAEIEDFDAEGEREARVFTLWLNSLDVKPAVVSFFDDLKDGTVLLQAYDKVIPGSVNWRHANKPPANAVTPVSQDPDEQYLTIKSGMSRFKAMENTNYAVEIGKQNRFSLVGIQGADITDGQRTLTLGMVWQLMRRDITNTLTSLAQRLGKREITDSDMVQWANGQAAKGGNKSQIRSFKDSSLATAIPLLDVLSGMKSSYVDYDLVAAGRTDDEKYANAKLAISIARKMGATIWLVPEDITALRSRLIVTFIGSLMATAEKLGA